MKEWFCPIEWVQGPVSSVVMSTIIAGTKTGRDEKKKKKKKKKMTLKIRKEWCG